VIEMQMAEKDLVEIIVGDLKCGDSFGELSAASATLESPTVLPARPWECPHRYAIC
jgi:hypothetical protein